MVKSSALLEKVEKYYSEKLKKYGMTPSGVDWNGKEAQIIRFEQLSKVIKPGTKFSIVDYGCGFGSYYDYLSKNFKDFNYIGYDISAKMIDAAKELYSSDNVSWTTKAQDLKPVDYVVSSGIFNVKLDRENHEWEGYIFDTLNEFNHLSILGFSFNTLTKYSDKELMREDLYYADPCYLFDYCKRNFSKYVALNHDYPLFDCTYIVRK